MTKDARATQYPDFLRIRHSFPAVLLIFYQNHFE